MTGDVIITVTHPSKTGPNAVISGLFFDAAPRPAVISQSSVKALAVTAGSSVSGIGTAKDAIGNGTSGYATTVNMSGIDPNSSPPAASPFTGPGTSGDLATSYIGAVKPARQRQHGWLAGQTQVRRLRQRLAPLHRHLVSDPGKKD